MEVVNQSKNGFHLANLIIIVLATLAVFGIGWSAFVKPTTTNRIADGGTQIIYNKPPEVPIIGCSLWHLNARASWETIPKQEIKK